MIGFPGNQPPSRSHLINVNSEVVKRNLLEITKNILWFLPPRNSKSFRSFVQEMGQDQIYIFIIIYNISQS